jgi:hypothetical protein
MSDFTEFFKSMNLVEKSEDLVSKDRIKAYLEKLGISGAGPIPNSLLSRQDLEGTEREYFESATKSQDIGNFAVWYYDSEGARKCAVFGNMIDAQAYADIVDSLGYKDVSIMKGQLEEAKEDAKDADTKQEVKSIVERIKNIQIKRQKMALNTRGAQKSFKQKWSELTSKGGPGSGPQEGGGIGPKEGWKRKDPNDEDTIADNETQDKEDEKDRKERRARSDENYFNN